MPEKFHLTVGFLEEPPFINLAMPDPVTGRCNVDRGVKCKVQVQVWSLWAHYILVTFSHSKAHLEKNCEGCVKVVYHQHLNKYLYVQVLMPTFGSLICPPTLVNCPYKEKLSEKKPLISAYLFASRIWWRGRRQHRQQPIQPLANSISAARVSALTF